MKRILSLILALSSLFTLRAYALTPLPDSGPAVEAPSALLMEKRTGTVLFEKEGRQRCFPASITKIMTMLLIVEALEGGSIALDGIVTASERASSFGGSCVYLETGERMTVSDMLKCIAVVSANDCAVAMAEYISGSETKFVALMNARAQELGLEDTHYTNCTGLFDDGEHYTTALDVALLSRELMGHELIKDYTTIWMDSIRNGEFELSNTNKLVYWYPGCTGLKTGYTSASMYCLSATAERDGEEYIAVIMGGASSDSRNADAMELLDYAFAGFSVCSLRSGEAPPEIPVELGRSPVVATVYGGAEYAVIERNLAGEPEFRVESPKSVPAPVKSGDQLGTVTVSIRGQVVAELPLCAAADVPRLGFFGILRLLGGTLFGL